jgi:hypothetical protein
MNIRWYSSYNSNFWNFEILFGLSEFKSFVLIKNVLFNFILSVKSKYKVFFNETLLTLSLFFEKEKKFNG